jgi:hypothetical protein
MKKLFSICTFIITFLALIIGPVPAAAVGDGSTPDQYCSAIYPFDLLTSVSVFTNGPLEQYFTPTQNRVRHVVMNWIVQATGTGNITVEIVQDSDGKVLASADYQVSPVMNGDFSPTVTFYKDGNVYDVPVVPGEDYKIRLTTSSPFAGVNWAYNQGNINPGDCDPNGTGVVDGGWVPFDFGFATYGLNYRGPVYRFWSDNYHGHFYTMNASEKDFIITNDPNWKYEGSVFESYPDLAVGTKPVYRFWSDNYKHHFYTISGAEKNSIIANDPNWKYEGIAYYAFSDPLPNTTALYRFWSDSYSGHFYTTSAAEKDNVIASMPEWKYEGTAYYVPTGDMVIN